MSSLLRTILTAVVIALCGISVPSGQAQDDEGTGRTREALPPVYLRDQNGKLVYIPDVSFEQWQRLFHQWQNLSSPERPTITIDRMTLRGQVKDQRVEVSITFVVTRHASEGRNAATWLPVPLYYPSLILTKTVSHDGQGEIFTTYSEDRDGYVCWLKAPADTSHTIRLSGVVMLDQVGGSSELNLRAPTVPESELTLDVAEQVEGQVHSKLDNSTRALSGEPTDTGGTRLSTFGVRGAIRLTWQPGENEAVKLPPRIDVNGSILVTVEAPQFLRSDARLVLKSYGQPLDRFQVRLPPRMRLLETPANDYEVTLADADPTQGQVATIQMQRTGLREATIRLVAETTLDPAEDLQTQANISFRAAQFEVLGAVRQRGTIDYQVEGDWTLSWTNTEALIRTDQGSRDGTEPALVARYRYFQQPCLLTVSSRPRSSRLSAAPRYEALVSADRVRLEATVDYRTNGSNIQRLLMDVGVWDVESVQTADGTTPLDFDLNAGGQLRISLPPEVTATGSWVLKLVLARDHEPEVIESAQPLRFFLPSLVNIPDARTSLMVAPVELTVQPADNVQLTPRLDDLQGLVADSPPTETNPTQSRQLSYRTRSGSSAVVFAAEFKVLPRSISVEMLTRVNINAATIDIEQQLLYSVFHESITELMLEVPAELIDAESVALSCELDGNVLPQPEFVGVAERGLGRGLVRIPLSESRKGNLEVRLTHSQPMPSLKPGTLTPLTVRLVRPMETLDSSLLENQVTVPLRQDLKLELNDPQWLTQDTDGSLLQLSGGDAVDLTLNATPGEASGATGTTVLRCWIQSWLLNIRRERAVFVLRTQDKRIRIQLPAGANTANDLVVAVDGQEVLNPIVNRNVQLELRPEVPEHEYVVELWYSFDELRPQRGRMNLQGPVVDGARHVGRTRWQVILPRHEHLLWTDPAVTPELTWSHRFGVWDRQGMLSQEELELWTGASQQTPLPSGLHQYLFTQFGSSEFLEIATVGRSMLLLITSGLVLFIGLMLIYFPAARHPVPMLVVAVALGAAAFWEPTLTITFAELAIVGVLLTLTAKLLQWTLMGRPRVQRDWSTLERPGSSILALPAEDSAATTISSPGASPVVAPDSKSR